MTRILTAIALATLLVLVACDLSPRDLLAARVTPDSVPAGMDGLDLAEPDIVLPRLAGLPLGWYDHALTAMEVWTTVYGPRADIGYMAGQVHQESRWDCLAVSPVGARGCSQFMRSTERAYKAKYGVVGPIWDVEVALTLQSLYMLENARSCGPRFDNDRSIWWCMQMRYNGSPRSFDREHVAAGSPRTIPWSIDWPCLRGRWAWCRENRDYPVKIQRWRDTLYVPWLGAWAGS